MNMHFFHWFYRFPYLARLLMTVMFILILFGTIIHFVEPENFPSIFDGIWWAIVTTSTIGYGDFVPGTVPGRLIAMLLIFTGAGLVASYFVTIASSTVKKENAMIKGTVQVHWKHHFIIVGWNERSREIIKSYVAVHPNHSIVLIDSTLKESPFTNGANVLFVRGSGASDSTLLKANIKEADLILLTADPTRTEYNADMHTILSIVAIKGIAPNIYCIAEILTSEQIINAKRAGADEVIQSNKLISSMMNHAMIVPGISAAILDIIDSYHGVELRFIEERSLNGHTFESALNICIKEQKIPIGVKRDKKFTIAPPKEMILVEGDQLLVICQQNKSE
jgi:voltage-gated potassium channel